jgi:hypothetical protein
MIGRRQIPEVSIANAHQGPSFYLTGIGWSGDFRRRQEYKVSFSQWQAKKAWFLTWIMPDRKMKEPLEISVSSLVVDSQLSAPAARLFLKTHY